MSGYFAIGVEHGKSSANIGTLWRSAHNYGAAMLFTVGRRYRPQASDTTKAWRSVPLLEFATLDDLHAHLPYDCELVGVELDAEAKPLDGFRHLPRACYLLGAEDHGLSNAARTRCHRLVVIPGATRCLNVSVAGSIVIWHRWWQQQQTRAIA
jgi:tRNA G18 (ribose-2'-O)-methylase SpoU